MEYIEYHKRKPSKRAYQSKYRTVAKIPFAMLDIHQPGNNDLSKVDYSDLSPSQVIAEIVSLVNRYKKGSKIAKDPSIATMALGGAFDPPAKRKHLKSGSK